MRGMAGVPVALVLAWGMACLAQTVPAAGNTTPPAVQTTSETSAGAVAPDTRTEKQKALARQTERLFDLAAELKVEVDKTNKNILSLTVVQKAEEIELMAKGMKGQTKK